MSSFPAGLVSGHLAAPFRHRGKARRWEPKRLRLRVFAVVSGGRRLRLRLAERWPWAGELTAAATRLQALSSG